MLLVVVFDGGSHHLVEARRPFASAVSTAHHGRVGQVVKPEELAERDGWICWLCGGDIDPCAPLGSPASATIDHVVPRSRGGANDRSNMRLAHRRCNGRRGNRLPELEWPREFALLDAPPLWRSLRHIVPNGNRRSRRRQDRTVSGRRVVTGAKPVVVALAPTEATARRAGEWAAESARRFLGGRWMAEVSPTGSADCHVIRLSVEGEVRDPGRPL